MESGTICASPFWNQSISWNTKDPYLSECFKHLVLVIGSCAVLWAVAPFEFIKICRYRGYPAPWSTLSISKLVCKVILLIVCIIDLIKEVYAYTAHTKDGLDGLIAAVAYLVTIVLTVVITMMCKKRGLRSSLALPSFWMISTVTTLISIYDDIHALDKSSWVSIVSLVDDSMTFAISVLQLILSNMSEKGTTHYGRELMDYCPLEGRTLFSRLTFSWLHGLLVTSVKKSLHVDDLIPLCSEFRSVNVSNRFNEIWNSSEIYRKASISPTLTNEESQENAEYHMLREDLKSQSHHEEQKRKSLLKTLLKISRLYLGISAFFEGLYTILYFLPVYILSLLLNDMQEPVWHFYLYVVALFVVQLLTTFVDSQRKYYGLTSALKIKTAVMNAVFEKALVTQELQNAEKCLQEEAENLFQMICLSNEVWGTPVRIILGLYLLWLYLGTACFVGIGTGAVLIPVTVLIGNTASYFKTKALNSKAEWFNILSECLHGIRSLKLYSWEDVFFRKIMILRNSEVRGLGKTRFLRIFSKIILLCSVSLVSLAAFTYFVIITDTFDMKIIFLSFYLIYLLRSPFINILRLLAHFVQGLSSISRIQKFLETKEVESLLQPDCDSECRICLKDATFTWANNKDYFLKNITLNFSGNCLVAVVGEPKSGKSSLLRALLGEMEKVDGSMCVKGEIAFVSDQSWIQNTTLEENVLFGKRKIENFYYNLLKSSDLVQDIEALPQGDETQIGDKGYSLNIDQKLKVDLARAVYQNAKIYIIDDLFRCADTSAAEQLFENIIGHRGLLCNKIRIFTTTSTKLLPLVDHIIFLKDGEIAELGDYSELVSKNGYFAEYLNMKWRPKFCETKHEQRFPNEDISFTNYKYRWEPWYSATGLSFKPEVDSFMQGEIMTAPHALLRKVLNYIQVNDYFISAVAVLTAIAANGCEVASLTWWAWRTSEHEVEPKMHRDIYIYAGFLLSQVLSCIICGILVTCGNTLAIRNFFKWLLDRIIRAPVTTLGPTFVERILHSFDKDLQYADEEIPVGIYVWLIAVFKVPVLLMTIFVHCPLLFLLFLYLIGTAYVVQRYYMYAWRQLHYLSTSTSCPLFNFVQNTFQGISNIRTSKSNDHFITLFRTKLDAHNKCNFLFLLVSRWLSNSIEILGAIFIVIFASAYIYKKDQGDYSIGVALVFSMQLPESLIALIYLSSMLDIDLSCLERFTSFSNVKQEAKYGNEISSSWLNTGSILIRNLKTEYGEGLYSALNNISIAVRPLEKVAVIGKEDSGVSAILDSLFRIKEITEGQIFIDNTDICHIGLRDLRSTLSIIPQDPLIFSGTLRENLDPEKNFIEEELQMAFKKSELHAKFVNLDSIVDYNVSTEEKYHIALARCILKMSKIVILEGTENSATAQYFQHSTVMSFGNFSLLDSYDRTICISSGEIVEVIS